MTFHNDLDKYSNNIAIITNQAQQISYKSLLNKADNIGTQIKKRSLVFVICKNCFESVAGYIGFMRFRATQVLISDAIDNVLFTNLLRVYKPAYIYLPTEKSGLNIDGKPVYSFGCYTLFKTNYKIDYTLHNDLALLLSTSGSTGSQKFVRQSYNNIYPGYTLIIDCTFGGNTSTNCDLIDPNTQLHSP